MHYNLQWLSKKESTTKKLHRANDKKIKENPFEQETRQSINDVEDANRNSRQDTKQLAKLKPRKAAIVEQLANLRENAKSHKVATLGQGLRKRRRQKSKFNR